jgi:hypothetical protein
MDPTLAPGYVAPSSDKNKSTKAHHSEVHRRRAEASKTSTNVTPPSSERPKTADRVRTSIHKRLRMDSRNSLSDGEGIGGPADLEEVPVGVTRQALRLDEYVFPTHRLRTVMDGS